MLIGLTATPKDEVDHNTYRLFHLEDGVPTDSYSLDEAVDEGYLVPPRGVPVGTRFLRHGIRYQDLSEAEQEQWDSLDWGDEDPPEEIDPEELNRFLFNEDTVDKVLGTLMESGYKVAGGDRSARRSSSPRTSTTPSSSSADSTSSGRSTPASSPGSSHTPLPTHRA